MRTRVALALLVSLSLGGLRTARDAAAGPGTKVADAPYSTEFKSRVRKAIENGVRHLRTKQLDDHAASPEALKQALMRVDYEEAAAVTWALRRAGLPHDDAVFAKATKTLRARKPKTIDEACLLLLALSAQPLADGNPFAIEEAAKGPPVAPAVSKEDRALIDETAKYVLGRQVTDGGFGRALGKEYDATGGWGADIGSPDIVTADIPTTYLALLALEAAARCGVQVPAKTYVTALGLLIGWQAPKGPSTSLSMNQVRGPDRYEWTEKAHARGFAWAGSMSDEPTGYETVGGAIALVICQDALQKDRGFTKELRRDARAALRDSLAWIQQNYDIKQNPVPVTKKRRRSSDIGSTLYHHHWLQGLARLAIHARMRLFGTHDWYQEGAEVLLATQHEDGSWAPIWWENCYALLFLMRASLTSVVPVVTVSETDGGK